MVDESVILGAWKPKVIMDGASMDAYGTTPYTTCFRYIRERMEKGALHISLDERQTPMGQEYESPDKLLWGRSINKSPTLRI